MQPRTAASASSIPVSAVASVPSAAWGSVTKRMRSRRSAASASANGNLSGVKATRPGPSTITVKSALVGERLALSPSSSVTVTAALTPSKPPPEAVWVITAMPSILSASEAAATVTVCAVVQFDLVNVKVAGLTVMPASSSRPPRLATVTVTSPLGQ